MVVPMRQPSPLSRPSKGCGRVSAKLCGKGHRYRGRGPCPRCKKETDAHYTSPLYRRNRKLCFERDGYRCRRCGTSKNLTAHHKIPVRAGGTHDLDNLETMCDADNKRADAEYRAGVMS